MAEYQDKKFRNHKSISGTFIRFLTRNMADQSALGLKGKVDSMDSDVKKLQSEIKEQGEGESRGRPQQAQ